MRFGLQIPNFTPDAPAGIFDGVVAMATAAEDSGFDSVWVMDHFYQLPPMGGPDAPMLDSYTLLGALAARTSRGPPGRDGDRRDLSQPGASGQDRHHPRHHQWRARHPRPRCGLVRRRARGPRIRLPARTRAPRSSGGGPPDLPGDVPRGGAELRGALLPHRTRPATCRARSSPAGRRSSSAGAGRSARLQLVARYADMANFFGDVDTVARKVEVLRTHCKAEGRDPSEVVVSRLATLVLTSSPRTRPTPRNSCDRSPARSRRRRTSALPRSWSGQVEELAAAGVDYFIFNIPTGYPDTVRRVGAELVSRFAD